MNNHILLERMDEADIFLLNNLNEQNKFKNPNDVNVRVLLYNLDLVSQQLDENENSILRKRLDKIRRVFRYASNYRLQSWELNDAQDYLTYIADTKKTYVQGIDDTEQALSNIVNALRADHVPDEYSINYVLAQNGANGLTHEQQNRFEVFVPLINKISEIEKLAEAEAQKTTSTPTTQALVVQKGKPAFLKKILDFFKNKFSKHPTTKQEPKKKNSYQHVEPATVEANYENTNAQSSKPLYSYHHTEPATVETKPYESSFREEIKSTPSKPKNNINRSTQTKDHIVISDLHGDFNRWSKIRFELNKNPNLKVTILGDAMDRGEFGPEILLQIKELSDKGVVQYLPGNHDIFAYNYVKMRNAPSSQAFTMAKSHLERNGGKSTMKKLDNFQEVVAKAIASKQIEKNISLHELVDWLGNQPIQKKVTENNNLYNLSHAVFDEKLYAYDKNFNLSKALSLELNGGKNSEMYRRFLNCMWYRADDTRTHFYDLALPRSGISVVGHTPQKEVNLQHIQNRPVIVVDTGNGSFSGYSLNSSKSIDFEDSRYQ